MYSWHETPSFRKNLYFYFLNLLGSLMKLHVDCTDGPWKDPASYLSVELSEDPFHVARAVLCVHFVRLVLFGILRITDLVDVSRPLTL